MKARVAERAVEVLSEAFEIRCGETQDAAAIEVQAGEAGDEMDWRCDPGGEVGRTFSGCGHGRSGSGYSAHCSDRPRSDIREIGTAQPAREPGAPAAFEGCPLSETRDVLDTGKGTAAGWAVELALDEAG